MADYIKIDCNSSLASDPVRIFCIEFGICGEREEEDRPFDPEEQDPFQEDSHERTGGQQTMENDKISFDIHRESQKSGQEEVGTEEGEEDSSLLIDDNLIQGGRRSHLEMISI